MDSRLKSDGGSSREWNAPGCFGFRKTKCSKSSKSIQFPSVFQNFVKKLIDFQGCGQKAYRDAIVKELKTRKKAMGNEGVFNPHTRRHTQF